MPRHYEFRNTDYVKQGFEEFSKALHSAERLGVQYTFCRTDQVDRWPYDGDPVAYIHNPTYELLLEAAVEPGQKAGDSNIARQVLQNNSTGKSFEFDTFSSLLEMLESAENLALQYSGGRKRRTHNTELDSAGEEPSTSDLYSITVHDVIVEDNNGR